MLITLLSNRTLLSNKVLYSLLFVPPSGFKSLIFHLCFFLAEHLLFILGCSGRSGKRTFGTCRETVQTKTFNGALCVFMVSNSNSTLPPGANSQ